MTTDVLDHPRHHDPAEATAAAWPNPRSAIVAPFAPLPRPLPPDPRVAPAPFLTCGLTADELLRRAVANARPRYTAACERWAAVGPLFGVGRDAATDLCLKCGMNPLEVVQR